MNLREQPVLVTGASGYVGGRLVRRLVEGGYRVRCLVRSPRKLAGRPWSSHPNVDIVQGDLSAGSQDDLTEILRGCGAGYYLVHAMLSAGSDYAREDRRMAERFRDAAAAAGLRRIVYLGGLGELGDGLSSHLRSRREVGEMLSAGPVPVTELRAAMVIGSGSASFEILRYLVERLPVMVTPRWVSTECQPIAIRNVLGYLVDCLDVEATAGEHLDIGGREIMSYNQIMKIMAEERGLARRLIIPVPVLTPKLSSLWIHLVTPLSHEIARPLAEGLRNRVVCRDHRAQQLMPQTLLTVREAIAAALRQTEAQDVETAWHSAGKIPGDPDWAGGTTFTDRRTIEVRADPSAVFRAVCRVGGGHGYYAADWLWRLRGWMDRMVGGPGLRRGRRDPVSVAYGEALDFWRVTGIERDRSLALRAEMKLPGEALLRFDMEPAERQTERTCLHQTASFKPKGLFGLAYWYAVLPLHGIVFKGMLDGIRRAAEQERNAASVPDKSGGSSAAPPG